MTAMTQGFVGARLTQARQARGISATDLADLIGVSVQSISKYENEHQCPKLEVSHRLAEVLGIPFKYFLRPMKIVDEKPIFWRARLSAPPMAREKAEVRLDWMKEIVAYLEMYFDLPKLNVPQIKVSDSDFADSDFVEKAAREIREYWSINSGPMPDVVECLENNGVLVSRIHVNADKLDAFSQWSDRFGIPFVVLSRNKASAVRQRFDALHELVHIVLHASIPQRRLNDRAFYKSVEKQADQIACAILLPEEEFSNDLFMPSLDGFLTIKERWGTSVAAMTMRSKFLGIIDDDEAKRLWINYSRRGWRNGEPLDQKMQKEEPQLIKRSFEMLIEEGVRSAPQILDALPFPAQDIEELADLEPGTLSGKLVLRAAPLLKGEFRQEESNVVQLFQKKATPSPTF